MFFLICFLIRARGSPIRVMVHGPMEGPLERWRDFLFELGTIKRRVAYRPYAPGGPCTGRVTIAQMGSKK